MTDLAIYEFFIQDGGSLDVVVKKAGRIPEKILGVVTYSVSYLIFLL